MLVTMLIFYKLMKYLQITVIFIINFYLILVSKANSLPGNLIFCYKINILLSRQGSQRLFSINELNTNSFEFSQADRWYRAIGNNEFNISSFNQVGVEYKTQNLRKNLKIEQNFPLVINEFMATNTKTIKGQQD